MDDTAQVLRRNEIFAPLDASELAALARSVSAVEFAAGDLIIRQGEAGREMFLVVDGEVQVFTLDKEGDEVVLDKWGAGKHFGEQALLPGASGERNASVRASTDVRLLAVPRQAFLAALAKTRPLAAELARLGEEQMRKIMLRQSAVLRSLGFIEEAADWYREEVFDNGHILFAEGDPGDKFYLILAGTAAVYRQQAGAQELVTRLGEGQGFGELALLKREPRSATIIAQGELKVLSIEGDAFRRMYQKTPELREYLQSLQRAYPLVGRGFVTQHEGTFMGLASITTIYHLLDGTKAVASNVVGQHLFNMTLSGTGEDGEVTTLEFRDPELGLERRLVLSGDRPRIADARVVGVMARGPWQELGRVQGMILEGASLDPGEAALFERRGLLTEEVRRVIYEPASVVCDCLQITYATLRQAIERGGRSADDLARETGASTVCGACSAQLRDLVGHGNWTPVMVAEEFELTEGIRSFRLQPYGGALPAARPGQHVLVQARIDGRWVQRPYTISAAAQETAFREITVKREPHGFFSNWLFDRRTDDVLLRISEPQGEETLALDEPRPAVCLVAGIGMTPALAMCRSLLAAGSERRLAIDYSASTGAAFAHREELEEAAATGDHIRLRLRATAEEGRLDGAGVREIVERHPGGEYFVCGPEAYNADIRRHLLAAGVAAADIRVEEFTPVGDPVAGEEEREAAADKTYVGVGAALLAAFLLQDAFGLKWPWLEALQAGESFKRWSGLAVLLFLASQFYLSALRARGRLLRAAGHYPWHKLQGAFAPLVYYCHSTTFGYGVLLFLSALYFGNTAFGLINQEVVARPRWKKRYTFSWISTHVVLSVLTAALALYHVLLVFSYR